MRKNEGLLVFKVTPNLIVIAKQGQDELLSLIGAPKALGRNERATQAISSASDP